MTEAPASSLADCRIVRQRRTVYALCPTCGMDVLWPSWCKCEPRRVHRVADLDSDRP